uniref:Uncharacterized protein n=1 Tax=Dunaliella tertiolecta TaxID=3047 RepID=A0A7S3VPN0_DUNTE
MNKDSHGLGPEWRAKNAIEKALRSVEFFSTKAKARVSTTLEGRLHEPELSPRLSVEVSNAQVDEAVLETIDDVEASLCELREMSMAAKSFAVPPIKHINTLEARKPAIASPKLTSTSPEERVQRAKSESAARDQWHQQRRLQQELQQMQQAASDGHSGTRQKLRRGSQEYPSSLSLLGKANSRQTSMELQRQSGTDAGGSTQDQQRGHVAAAGGSRRNSLEQRKGAAAAAARRSSLEQREGAAASGARRNSSMESSGGFRKSCSLARFEASHAQPPDNPPLAPSGAQNTTHPTTKGRGRGGALAHQHHEPPPPFAQPGRLRGSVPEFLLHGASPADEGQQPLMLPPDPSVGAHVDGMPQESRSGPLALYRGNGQPLPRRFSQLQLRTDLSSPSPSLSPSNPNTAPNTFASSSPSSSGPLAPLNHPPWHPSVTTPTPTGNSTQHHQSTLNRSSGPLPSVHGTGSSNSSQQALQALKPTTPTSLSGPLRPLPPNTQHSLLTPNAQLSLLRPEQQPGTTACPPAAAADEGQNFTRDASTARSRPPAKGRFMLATQASINRSENRLEQSESAKKRRSSRTGRRLSHSTSSCRRRVKRTSSSRSQGKRRSSSGKRASSTGRRKGVRSQSSTRRGPPSRTASQTSLISTTSHCSSTQSKGSRHSRNSSEDGSDFDSDAPSVSSVVSGITHALLSTTSNSAPEESMLTLPGLFGASHETNNKSFPLQPSMAGHTAALKLSAHFAGFPTTRPTTSHAHVSSTSSTTSAASFPHPAAPPSASAAAAATSAAVGNDAGGPDSGKPASKSAPRKRAPTKQASNVRFNLPAVNPPRSPCPSEEPNLPTHPGKVIAIAAPKSKSSPTTAASSPKTPTSRASGEGLSIPVSAALAKDALAEVPNTFGKITKQTASLRQYLAGNRLDVSRLDLDTYLKKLDNENKGRSRSVGRFAGNKKQGRSKSGNLLTHNHQHRGACAGEGDPPAEDGDPALKSAQGSGLASMFAQLGQEEQELQQLHERMRAAAVKGREHGSGVDQRSLWRG